MADSCNSCSCYYQSFTAGEKEEMTDVEKIRLAVEETLRQLGYKPRGRKHYYSQNEALRLLVPVRIGRRRLATLVQKGFVRIKDKADYSKRNSKIRYYAEDIDRLLNE